MSLRPLGDVLAVRSPDPGRLESLERDLRGSGRFDEVWRPAPGWIAAAAALPGSEADGEGVRRAGLAFVEGRDVVGAEDAGRAAQIAKLAAVEPDTLDGLPGDFTFLAFGPDGSMTAVRAAAGLAPLYLAGGGKAVSSRMDLLLRFGLAAPELDPLPNALWLSGSPVFPDGRSLVAGVRALDRGTFTRVSPNGEVRSGSYWDPRNQELAPPTEAALEERGARLRTILLERLTSDLSPEGGNLLSLSGGMDSSSLLALAAGTLGLPVAAASLLPGAGPALDRELGYIRAASERGPLVRHFTYHLNAETGRRLRASAPLVAVQCPHPILMALPEIAGEWPVRVLFGGEIGDEIAGSHVRMEDWVHHTSLPRLVASVGRFPNGPQDAGRWVKWRLARRRGRPRIPFPDRLGPWAHPDLHPEYGAWLEARRAGLLADERPVPNLALRGLADGWVAMNWEVTGALGVRRSAPFFNRAALELAFGTHPRTLMGPGMKRLLRRGLAGDVPRRVLERPDKGRWGPAPVPPPVTWEEPLDSSLGAILHPSRLPGPPGPVDSSEASVLSVLVRFLNGARAAAEHDPTVSRPSGRSP